MMPVPRFGKLKISSDDILKSRSYSPSDPLIPWFLEPLIPVLGAGLSGMSLAVCVDEREQQNACFV